MKELVNAHVICEKHVISIEITEMELIDKKRKIKSEDVLCCGKDFEITDYSIYFLQKDYHHSATFLSKKALDEINIIISKYDFTLTGSKFTSITTLPF